MSDSSGKGIGQSISDFFASLTKEPAEEMGGMLADRVRFWRVKHAVRLREKLDEFLLQRGVTNRRCLPLKLTIAILDGATMEDDEELHTEWAKLLANAVDPSFTGDVRVAYADILRSLNAIDARLLHEIYNVASQVRDTEIHRAQVNLIEIANRIEASKAMTELSRECLLRQRCITLAPKMFQPGQYISHGGDDPMWVTPPPQQIGVLDHVVVLTQLGAEFVRACN